MKKILVHGEYMCILNLLALPFLIIFFNQDNNVFWLLLLFLDVAEMFLVEENAFLSYLMKKELFRETLRIKIYMVAIVVFYVYIAIAQSWALALIIVGNDIISTIANDVVHKYIHKINDKASE